MCGRLQPALLANPVKSASEPIAIPIPDLGPATCDLLSEQILPLQLRIRDNMSCVSADCSQPRRILYHGVDAHGASPIRNPLGNFPTSDNMTIIRLILSRLRIKSYGIMPRKNLNKRKPKRERHSYLRTRHSYLTILAVLATCAFFGWWLKTAFFAKSIRFDLRQEDVAKKFTRSYAPWSSHDNRGLDWRVRNHATY